MAKIDPELQKNLNAAVMSVGAACKRLCAKADDAALAIQDFAMCLDTMAKKSSKADAAQAIAKAKK